MLSLIERIRQLIATPSVSSVNPPFDMGNRPVIDLLANWLEEAGFAVQIQPIPGRPDKANLIAVKGRGEGGLVLSGHTDTVPYDDALWSTDPFRATEKDHRLYGLGSTDMKSFLALAIAVAEEISANQLQAPLYLIATADEESSMSGAKALVAAADIGARHAVIGEPTGLKPVRMHKGVMMEGIRVVGRSGHSSNPALGRNALEGMCQVMSELLEFRSELQQQYRNPLFSVPVPTLNLGHIHGGDNPNRICGQCDLSIDLRPLPGMEIRELRALLHQRLQHRLADTGMQLVFEPAFEGVPPFAVDADAEIVQAAVRLSGSEPQAVAFGTEAPYLQQLGMEVVVMGPGSIDVAHQPDEFLPLDQVQPCLHLLRELIREFCVSPQSVSV
ncbi:MAG: acetylornithine deacetylase [Pseudomonadota bacterium]